MSNRIYDYLCENCGKYFDALRPEAERRADIECPHCGHLCNGDKCKRICTPAEVRFVGGRQKGYNNSHGGY